MPVYEYACIRCQHRFELLRPMSFNGDVSCPRCGQEAQRVLSTFAALSRSAGGEVTPVAGTGACSACAGGVCPVCPR